MGVLPEIVKLHGLGGQKDLPLPLPLAVAAAVQALLVSFVVLAVAWRSPRYEGVTGGRPAPAALARVVDAPATAWTIRILGLLFFGYLTWAMVAGPDLVTNPALGVFYVLVWVGLVPLSLLLGPVVRAVSPVRTINLLLARVTGGDASKGLLTYPARLGYWPAAVMLFAFVWQELVNPGAPTSDSVRLWLIGYLAVMLVGAAVFGEVWLRRADPFEVYSELLAKLSVWARDDTGRLVVRSPLANLSTVPPAARAGRRGRRCCSGRPPSTATRTPTAGSASSPTPAWATPSPVRSWLLVFCLAVGGTFTAAAMSTGIEPGRRTTPTAARSAGPLGRADHRRLHDGALPQLLRRAGPEHLIQLSDPMVRGDNFLGTGDWRVNYWLSFHPTLLAS